MKTDKIISFEDERYKRLQNYVPYTCNNCNLTPEQRLEKCMNGCYDEIERDIKSRNTEITVQNILISTKSFQQRVSLILESFN